MEKFVSWDRLVIVINLYHGKYFWLLGFYFPVNYYIGFENKSKVLRFCDEKSPSGNLFKLLGCCLEDHEKSDL